MVKLCKKLDSDKRKVSEQQRHPQNWKKAKQKACNNIMTISTMYKNILFLQTYNTANTFRVNRTETKLLEGRLIYSTLPAWLLNCTLLMKSTSKP